jgi:hypothetical protein
MKIVSDGPERLRDATQEQKAKRKEEIRAELSESANRDLAEAGFFRRLLIKYKLRAELRKKLNSEFPQSGCLHLVPQK